MDDILDYLEEVTQPDDLGPEYRALVKKQLPFDESFQNATSFEFMSQWSAIHADVITFERKECFSRGFRLGAQLILALAEPSSPDTHHRS